MAGRAEKIRQRLREEIKAGSYYEAQQTYKATYYRYTGKGAHDDANALLRDGVTSQLQHGQLTCGSELLNMLLQAYLDNSVEVDAELLAEVQRFLQLLANVDSDDTAAVVLELRKCCGAALKWTKKCGERSHTRSIHSTAGSLVFKVLGPAGLGQAALYYRLSTDVKAFASAIRRCMDHGRLEERELFMARGVLQILSSATKPTSVTQLHSARALWALLEPDRAKGSKSAHVGHFVELLLVCLGKLSKPAFDLLMREYRNVLDLDPEFEGMMHDIEAAYFGTGKAAGGLGKMLEGLLGGM
eukprot:jgi/Ulvmu1/8807/UM048_0062.1